MKAALVAAEPADLAVICSATTSAEGRDRLGAKSGVGVGYRNMGAPQIWVGGVLFWGPFFCRILVFYWRPWFLETPT